MRVWGGPKTQLIGKLEKQVQLLATQRKTLEGNATPSGEVGKTYITPQVRKLQGVENRLNGMINYAKSSQKVTAEFNKLKKELKGCLLYTSPSPRDRTRSRMPSSA